MKLAIGYIRQTSNGVNFIKKTFSWILLFLGLLIIFYSLFSSFNIFTGKTIAPEIFKIEETALFQKSETQDIQAQLRETISEQLKGMLPADSFPTLLNLISWSIFAGILIFGGAQISSLGIRLLK